LPSGATYAFGPTISAQKRGESPNAWKSLVPSNVKAVTPIPPGGRIKFTQSPVSLEHLIGQMIFSQPGAQKKPEEGEAPPK